MFRYCEELKKNRLNVSHGLEMGVVFCKDSQFAKIYNTAKLPICDIFLNSTKPVFDDSGGTSCIFGKFEWIFMSVHYYYNQDMQSCQLIEKSDESCYIP